MKCDPPIPVNSRVGPEAWRDPVPLPSHSYFVVKPMVNNAKMMRFIHHAEQQVHNYSMDPPQVAVLQACNIDRVRKVPHPAGERKGQSSEQRPPLLVPVVDAYGPHGV